jgi:hypothetical protein
MNLQEKDCAYVQVTLYILSLNRISVLNTLFSTETFSFSFNPQFRIICQPVS